MKISFRIPGRPAGWQRPIEGERADGSFYRYNDRDAEDAKLAIAKAYKAASIGRRPSTGPVKLTIIAVFAIPPSWPAKLRARALEGQVWHVARGQLDLDNAIKLVGDALNRVAYVDDAQVAVITCGKRYGLPERTEIIVEALPQQDDERTPGQRSLERRVAEEGWDKVLAPPTRRANRSKTDSPGPRRKGRGRGGRAGAPTLFRGFPRPGERP